jgi:uncharacterized Fe-S cluster-containing radical SAM superfamily protein
MSVEWRIRVIDAAWRRPLLWRGLKAVHPRYISLRCRLRRRPRLGWVQIEVTNGCNLACTMCGSRFGSRERGLMARDVFLERIAQIPDGSLHHIAMHAGGEPLLHPDLELFVRCARTKATEVFLSTNGLLFGRDAGMMRRLLDAGLTHIHFSTEGYDAETYEAARIGGRFDDFIANLSLLRRVRDRAGSAAEIHVQYTLLRPFDPQEIRSAAAVLGPHADAVEFRPLNNQSLPSLGYRPDERIAGTRCFRDEPLPCLALWCGLTVLWDGRVSLCPRDHSGGFVGGDARTPIAAAWSGAAARALRSAHAHGRPPDLCRGCSEPRASTLDMIELNRNLQALGGCGGCARVDTPRPRATAIR